MAPLTKRDIADERKGCNGAKQVSCVNAWLRHLIRRLAVAYLRTIANRGGFVSALLSLKVQIYRNAFNQRNVISICPTCYCWAGPSQAVLLLHGNNVFSTQVIQDLEGFNLQNTSKCYVPPLIPLDLVGIHCRVAFWCLCKIFRQ